MPQKTGSRHQPTDPRPRQFGGSRYVRFRCRIELKFLTALCAECLPTAGPQLGTRALRVGHPPEDVAHHVNPSHAVEVGGVQPTASELVHGGQEHLVKNSQQRGRRTLIGRNVETRSFG